MEREDPDAAESAVGCIASLASHLLPSTSLARSTAANALPAAHTARGPAPETRAPVESAAAAAAAEATAIAVLQMARAHWIVALERAAGAGGACAASEGLWEEVRRLCHACCCCWRDREWLAGCEGPIPAAAREAWEAMLLLSAQVFCSNGHTCCLECLVDALEPPGTAPPGEAAAPAVSDAGTAARTAVAAAAGQARVSKAVLAVLEAAARAIESDPGELMLPALRLAAAMLQLVPEALCESKAALGALWALVLAGGFGGTASAEARDEGMGLLQLLLEIARHPVRLALQPSPASARAFAPRPLAPSPPLSHPSVSAPMHTDARLTSSQAEGSTSPATLLILNGLRPHVPSLLLSLCSAVAHAAPASAVDPAAQLLLAVAQTFPAEWQAALPVAVEQLAGDLRERGRALSPRAAELLLGGALRQPLLAPKEFVALWNDVAQITRMGTSEQALVRYQPRST